MLEPLDHFQIEIMSSTKTAFQIWIRSSSVDARTGWTGILREDSWSWGYSCCWVRGQVLNHLFCILANSDFSLEDGTVFDSSASRGAPFGKIQNTAGLSSSKLYFRTGPFVHGRGQIIQGYTEVLTGRYVAILTYQVFSLNQVFGWTLEDGSSSTSSLWGLGGGRLYSRLVKYMNSIWMDASLRT